MPTNGAMASSHANQWGDGFKPGQPMRAMVSSHAKPTNRPMASSQANQWGAMALSFSSVILLTLGVNINKNKKKKDIPFGSHTLLLFCYQTLYKRPRGNG
ncbi:unnamed protein product [Arctogadus glacialis]